MGKPGWRLPADSPNGHDPVRALSHCRRCRGSPRRRRANVANSQDRQAKTANRHAPAGTRPRPDTRLRDDRCRTSATIDVGGSPGTLGQDAAVGIDRRRETGVGRNHQRLAALDRRNSAQARCMSSSLEPQNQPSLVRFTSTSGSAPSRSQLARPARRIKCGTVFS